MFAAFAISAAHGSFIPLPSADSEARIFWTKSANSAGSAALVWSGPGIDLSSVKCFSIIVAPSATAAMDETSLCVWSLYPIAQLNSERSSGMTRKFASATADG